MSGIRLHHPSFRAAEGTTLTYVVELPLSFTVTKEGGRDRSAEPCPRCAKPHRNKSLHLDIDANGDVIVAPAIYAQLQTVPTMAGLEMVNEVKSPPPLFIGAVPKDKSRIVEAPLSGLPAADLITPASNRYENRDRLLAPYQPVVEKLQDEFDRKQTKKQREKRKLFVSTRRES